MVEEASKANSKVSDANASDDVEQSLYAKRQKIYPREVKGVCGGVRNNGV